ncbi:MAG: radical SAM protein [Candidatus Omnitrophica bacterium]|nr:radical SAM protein [Candidatus Omnitrophota bacterium]MCK5288440.1 radical SAM protein [Candidatus Omnitrophota bacterium]
MKRIIKQTNNLISFIDVKRCRWKQIFSKNILFPIIWVTRRCNLRCRMCQQWQTSSEILHEELTTKEWYSFIDAAYKLKAAVIIITGGEPLLRSDIFDIIRYIRIYGISVHLCTNGTLINEDIIKGLRFSGVNSISVSIDSYLSDIHNQMRGVECYDKVMEGIKLMKKSLPGIKIGINTLITKRNFRNIYKMVAFAEELKVDQIKFSPIHTNLKHKNNNQDCFKELIFKDEDLFELSYEVKKLIKAISLSRLLSNSLEFLNGLSFLYNSDYQRVPCFAGYISCSVDSLGWVSPCEDIEGNENLRDKSLENILKSKAFNELRKKVHQCTSKCWDTTHTEINIRCSTQGFIRQFCQILKESFFYLR